MLYMIQIAHRDELMNLKPLLQNRPQYFKNSYFPYYLCSRYAPIIFRILILWTNLTHNTKLLSINLHYL